MHFRRLSHAYVIFGLSTRSYLVSCVWEYVWMSMQENVHVCVVLNRVHFLNEYSQIARKTSDYFSLVTQIQQDCVHRQTPLKRSPHLQSLRQKASDRQVWKAFVKNAQWTLTKQKLPILLSAICLLSICKPYLAVHVFPCHHHNSIVLSLSFYCSGTQRRKRGWSSSTRNCS